MDLTSFEKSKASIEALLRYGDEQLVEIVERCEFLELNRKIFFSSTPEHYHSKWEEMQVRIVSWVIDEVLDLVIEIYLFKDQPVSLDKYIKGRLRRYYAELRDTMIEMLNLCLNDSRRFPSKIKLDYVKNKLRELKASNIGDGIVLDKGSSFDFFKITSLSQDEFAEALVHSWGMAMTEKEEIDELSKRYFELTGRNIKSESLPPQPLETKTDKFKSELGKYGFFELPKVKQLSEPNKQKLIELISSKPMPYGIAMFDELGFCEFLDNEKGTKTKANVIISRLFNTKAKDGTAARHYRNSLIKPNTRYNADKCKEIVKTDYQKLK